MRASSRIRALIALASRRKITIGSVREEIARLVGKPASYRAIGLVNIRNTRVGRFPHRPQNRGRRSGARLRADFDERDQALQGQLLDALALRRRDPLKAPTGIRQSC